MSMPPLRAVVADTYSIVVAPTDATAGSLTVDVKAGVASDTPASRNTIQPGL